jgi:hypothetical protein
MMRFAGNTVQALKVIGPLVIRKRSAYWKTADLPAEIDHRKYSKR